MKILCALIMVGPDWWLRDAIDRVSFFVMCMITGKHPYREVIQCQWINSIQIQGAMLKVSKGKVKRFKGMLKVSKGMLKVSKGMLKVSKGKVKRFKG